MTHTCDHKVITFPAGFTMNRCDCGQYKFADPKDITHDEAVVLIKDMILNGGVFFEEYLAALKMAVNDMEDMGSDYFTCQCGNTITAYCNKCGGYVSTR